MESGPLINRRTALAGVAALPLIGCTGMEKTAVPGVSVAEGRSLNSLALRGGRRFGSAVASTPWNADAGSFQNPAYAALVKAECGLVVPENEMKWQALRPSRDTYDFTRMDALVAWAQSQNLDVRGHTLLWHRPQWFPGWLNDYDFGANPMQEAERLLTQHIRAVTDRYRGIITSYDVVNEAIDHDARKPIETSMSRAMGSPEAVIDLAFQVAREQLPDAQLVYNDYMSWEPQHAEHRADVLRLLEGLRKRGTPVDALGIQSHIEIFDIDPVTGVGVYDDADWRSFLDEVTGMGYRLLITEFDVKDKALPADLAVRDATVADFTRRYFDLMLEYSDHLDDVLVWGMVDRFNWLQNFEPAARDDGLEVRAAPYDSDYQPKPMRYAIEEALRRAAG